MVRWVMRWLLLFIAIPAFAVNFVPNSSFECGTGRGWFTWDTSGFVAPLGNSCFITEQRTNVAWHGGSSFSLLTLGRLLSRPIWLTNGTYCLSYYAKAQVADAPMFAGVVPFGSALFGFIPPLQNGNATATWTRFTTNVVVTSNNFHYIKFIANPGALIDGIQLEPGTTPTAYAPQSTIEAAIELKGTYAMFWAGGETPHIDLTFRNEGAAITARSRCQIYDVWNSNVVTYNLSLPLAAATNTSTTINLPSKSGWYRIVNRLLDVADSYDEACTIVYPFVSNTVANADTDWLGGHPHGSAFHIRREMLAWRHWGRTLSPAYFNTRWDIIEPTRGNFTYKPTQITNWLVGGMLGIGSLTPTDGFWPDWATNDSTRTNADFPQIGSADPMAFSNFCFRTVQTNKNYIHAWEIGPNEPAQSGPIGVGDQGALGETNLPINMRWPTNYARMAAYGIAGVTNADPTAKILFVAGSFGGGLWGWQAWTALTADIQSWITDISMHEYSENNDPNDLWVEGTKFTNPFGWVTFFNGIRPVNNTESGSYGLASYAQGLNGLWPENYDPMEDHTATGYPEAVRNERRSRSLTQVVRSLSHCLRTKGVGFKRFIYYDSRMFNDSSFTSTQPYPADHLGVDRPEVVALSVAQHMIQHGFGPITNTSSIYMEMYACTNTRGQSVVTVWSIDRTNRTVTLTNGAFAVFDCYGNLNQTNSTTVPVTRVPQYIVSGTLSLTQLSNTWRTASVDLVADVLPPLVSIDIAPTGLWSGDTNRVLFKWTALDDTAVAWPSNIVTLSTQNKTNVVYKWKLNSGSYTDYSQSNHIWLSNIPAGNNTFYVTASDKFGNAAEASYEFSPAAGTTNVLNVSGTAHIGTLTVP